jgi:hypothetical protein
MWNNLSVNQVLAVVDVIALNTKEASDSIDLSVLVTLQLNGVDAHAAMFYVRNSGLDVFDVQRSKYLNLPGHIEFRTFEFESTIRQHFGRVLEVA